MATIVKSIGLKGLEGYVVGAEAQSLSGVEQISVIGLPDASIKESKDRLKGALHSVGADVSGRHMILLLSPTEQKKNGPMTDLAMAIAMLKETHQLVGDVKPSTAFLGTLSLDGSIHETEGMLAAVMQAKALGFSSVYVPAEMGGLDHLQDISFLKPVHHLQEVMDHLNGIGQLKLTFVHSTVNEEPLEKHGYSLDFSEIVGHIVAKRGLMVAAAGGHHVLMSGPPGCGKSMLASAFPSILPKMTERTMIDSYSLYQLAHETKTITGVAPFRHPHHSASSVSLIGGGTTPRPGEVSLAHGGGLFLDEMAEFPKKTLDMLRQPLETGKVTISRVSGTVTYPAHFILIGATNPCPCGYHGAKDKYCTCTAKQIHSYQQRLSGPILDRMDIMLRLTPVNLEEKFETWTSADMKAKVTEARKMQYERYNEEILNSQVSYDRLLDTSPILEDLKERLQEWSMKYHFSNRVQVNILRTARTIADLNGEEGISMADVNEAIQFRVGHVTLVDDVYR
ncbi:YifB family Mg chelatase-like AAA ATPase [Halobacillus yeomjeoni]|uniref:YifB family Mg chelatase-like AAA ATPase n=1 Tax=Halobacillus yeomjeoni TaxID=311194 RepID=A0A931HVW4_9BACI|nr:YifB family Mg chelatase-like AAA ATPase [Halobacillus yeomjeoni]MBH0230762.1 YifB family Mg chelatase-like AAA ATPase [Halobacillus yeomjeoni]